MKRVDGRAWDELRPVKITPGFQSFAEGSALIELGKTRVLCSVSVEERVPPFLRGAGSGCGDKGGDDALRRRSERRGERGIARRGLIDRRRRRGRRLRRAVA